VRSDFESSFSQGGGGFPRTSERLAEGNLEQAYDNSLSHDGKGQPRVRIFRQVLAFPKLLKVKSCLKNF